MKNWIETLERIWCANMHGRPMWPVHGRYQCAICLREFPVKFEAVGHQVEGCENRFSARAIPREVSSY